MQELHLDRVLQIEPEPDAVAPLLAALCNALLLNVHVGRGDMAEACMQRAQAIIDHDETREPISQAWFEMVRGTHAMYVVNDAWGYLRDLESANARHVATGAGQIWLGRMAMVVGFTALGLFDRAERETAWMIANEPKTSSEVLVARYYACISMVWRSRFEEAWVVMNRVYEDCVAAHNHLIELISRLTLAELQVHRGHAEDAESIFDDLHDRMSTDSYLASSYWTARARARLERGRPGEALELIERAYAHFQRTGISHFVRHAVLLRVRAEVYHALGQDDRARAAIVEARDYVQHRLALIPEHETEVREAFLHNLPEHQRILALAEAWLGEG